MKVCECSWTSEVVMFDTPCNMNPSVQVSHRSMDAQRLLVTLQSIILLLNGMHMYKST